MALRLPAAQMEGLSIDVKKFASDASTFFNRARQYTEEQLGQAEKTQLDEEVNNLWKRFETTNDTITKLKASVEGLLQPNPNMRMEKMLLSKFDTGNTLGRPQEESQFQQLSKSMEMCSVTQKTYNEKYSNVLAAVGKAEGEIAQAEQKFINSTKDTVLRPFYSFVDNDAKTIFKEKKALETARLDLDAAKAKLKKVKTLEMRDQVEGELQAAQSEFMRQQELLKLLLENVASAQNTQLRAIMEFVNHQTAYLVSAADSAKALQSQVQDLAGELAQSGSASQFPRRNSNSNNVPVNDILKDEKK